MSVKKNLTVATLAALLAVPALGATNANVNADSTSTVTNYLTHSFDGYPAGTPIYDGHFYGGMNGNPRDSMQGSLGTPGTPNNIIPEKYESAHKSTISNKKNTNELGQVGKSNTSKYGVQNGLPQTGENDGASKAKAMGAVILGASASLMALGVAKKHKQEAELDTVTTEPAVNGGNNKDSNESNANESIYHMIVGNTFASISNDLKQL